MGDDVPLSLYVHLPFCKSLCWYCGCNVVIAREPSAAEKYLSLKALGLFQSTNLMLNRRKVAQSGQAVRMLRAEQLLHRHNYIEL